MPSAQMIRDVRLSEDGAEKASKLGAHGRDHRPAADDLALIKGGTRPNRNVPRAMKEQSGQGFALQPAASVWSLQR